MLKRWAALPPRIRWLAGIAAAALGLAVVWALFVPVTDWLARHDAGSATGPLHETALDNARGRLLTLGAGLVAAAALVFTALNFSLLRRNSEQADQWQRRTHELTEQGQVTDRYTKAIEQLGSDKLDVRIGGIYSLERIARDSASDHPTVMEVLTAFIREHSHEQWPLPDPDGRQRERRTRPDVQAAVTVVGRRDAKRDVQSIDLTGADLTRADLAGANLTHADLTDADLQYATLWDADLTHAHLSGADLSSAHLTSAVLIYADLAMANVKYATLHEADLTGAALSSADLRGAILRGAILRGAGLTGADLKYAILNDADLAGARLADAQFDGATDLTGAKWPEGTPVPEGWELDAGSGRLRRAGDGPGAG